MAIISNAVTIADAGAFSVSLGSKVHIKTLTASASATLSFVHGTADVVLDSTYPIYKFEFINIHVASGATFQFNMSTDAGSNYNVTKTTTVIQSTHGESDGFTLLRYNASFDLAQSTAFQSLNCGDFSTDNDASLSGELFIYNPSSTVFVKHFMSNTNAMAGDPSTDQNLVAGYGNTTSAVDAIRFQISSGNIDDGKIKLYGIKDS